MTSPAAAAPPAPASCTLASHAELKLDRERWIAGTTHAFYQDLAGTMAEFRYCKGCGSSLTRAKVSP